MRALLRVSTCALSALALASSLAATPAGAAVSVTAPVVIDEVYGGGGNSGATLTHDFVELYNRGSSVVDLTGWTVQYASAAGSSWQLTPLTGSLAPGRSYLVQQARGAGGSQPLATPDATGTIAMSATAGKVALVRTATALACSSGCAALPDVVDLVGYGATASSSAGSGPAPAPSNTTSVSRSALHTHTADNAADFTAGPPSPTSGATAPPPPATETVTIAEVQGPGATTPLAGRRVTTSGLVTAVYATGGLRGFYLQTPGTGGPTDPSTRGASDGVFVFVSAGPPPIVTRGAHLTVTGTAGELSGQTQITAAAADITDAGPAVAPVSAATTAGWPGTDAQRETLEGMLYRPTGDYTVTNTFATNQFGEVGLASGTKPLLQPTEVARPGSPEAAAVAADNASRAVVLDDGASVNFQARVGGSLVNGALTPPYLVGVPARVGAPVSFTSDVVLGYGFGSFRFQPLAPLDGTAPSTFPASFGATRTDAPDAGRLGDGELRVASFNVLNYFTTLAEGRAGCTPSFPDRDGSPNTASCADVRGAYDAADLARQQAKQVRAINSLGADVVGLVEVESSARLGEPIDEALASLVTALNADAGPGTWAFVPSSAELPAPEGRDVITNAIIYKPAAVERVGESRALGTQSDDGEPFVNAREPVAQVFRQGSDGAPFLFVVNHFKSKGSAGPLPGDADQGDGQGASNASRVAQATALRDWVPTVLPDTGTRAVVLAGDLNAYGEEDPIRVLEDAGYVSAGKRFAPGDHSYSFAGLSGSLDHVLLNADALRRATGADVWNINSGESLAFEYSRFNYHGTDFHTASPFRSSDHDPVVVGLSAERTATATSVAAPSVVRLGETVTVSAAVAGPAPTGQVRFAVGDAVLGTAPLVDGTATLPAVTLPVGPQRVTATYLGDAETLASRGSADVLVAYVVRLLSPGEAVRAGTDVTIAFQLTDVSGTPISDPDAAALVEGTCRVVVSAGGAQELAPTCAKHKPRQDRFKVGWDLGRQTGDAVVRIAIAYPGAETQVVTTAMRIKE